MNDSPAVSTESQEATVEIATQKLDRYWGNLGIRRENIYIEADSGNLVITASDRLSSEKKSQAREVISLLTDPANKRQVAEEKKKDETVFTIPKEAIRADIASVNIANELAAMATIKR